MTKCSFCNISCGHSWCDFSTSFLRSIVKDYEMKDDKLTEGQMNVYDKKIDELIDKNCEIYKMYLREKKRRESLENKLAAARRENQRLRRRADG